MIHSYMSIHTYMRTQIRTYIITYIHTYIHTHTYIHIHTYIHAYIHTYIHTVLALALDRVRRGLWAVTLKHRHIDLVTAITLQHSASDSNSRNNNYFLMLALPLHKSRGIHRCSQSQAIDQLHYV